MVISRAGRGVYVLMAEFMERGAMGGRRASDSTGLG